MAGTQALAPIRAQIDARRDNKGTLDMSNLFNFIKDAHCNANANDSQHNLHLIG